RSFVRKAMSRSSTIPGQPPPAKCSPSTSRSMRALRTFLKFRKYERLQPEPHKGRSEEHTSELQSRENLVCRLLLEKKKTTAKTTLPPTIGGRGRVALLAHHVAEAETARAPVRLRGTLRASAPLVYATTTVT